MVGLPIVNKLFVCVMLMNVVTAVIADESQGLLRLIEQGECHPSIDKLYKIAMSGDVDGQLAFGYAASKNLCEAVELGGKYSIDWFRSAAQQGNAAAQAELAKKLVSTWDATNEEEALGWYRLAADQGNANAQFGLAQMYDRGWTMSKNIPKSDSEAMDLYLKAAAQGHVGSFFVLSQIYGKGQMVKRDVSKEAYWNKKGAESDDHHAQVRLADMYKKGEGVAQSDAKARHWYSQANALGNKYAKTSLARMVRDGEGGPVDKQIAVKLFAEAAEAEESNAQYELGRIYLHGLLGVPKDTAIAKVWMIKAAQRLHPLAIEELEDLE